MNESSEATRTDTAIRDIPQAVYVVPAQVLRDQQVVRLADAVRNVSGVTIAEDAGGRQERVTMRGFVTDTTFQDGFRKTQALMRHFRISPMLSASIFSRGLPRLSSGVSIPVESSIWSQSSPSRTATIASRCRAAPINSCGPRSMLPALSRPINRCSNRFIASGQDSQSFRDFNFTRRLFLSPTLIWTPSPSTSLRLYTSFWVAAI